MIKIKTHLTGQKYGRSSTASNPNWSQFPKMMRMEEKSAYTDNAGYEQ
jgi:hypothetical protein